MSPLLQSHPGGGRLSATSARAWIALQRMQTCRFRWVLPAVSIGAGGAGGGAHTRDEWYQPDGRELGLRRILLVLASLSEAGHCHAHRRGDHGVSTTTDATASQRDAVKPHGHWKADSSLAVVALVWGTTFVLVKHALTEISTLYFLALRFSLGHRLHAAVCWFPSGATAGQACGPACAAARSPVFSSGLATFCKPLD